MTARPRDLSIERKFFLVMLPVSLLPVLGFALMVMISLRMTHEKTIGDELDMRASLFADWFDNFLHDRMDVLDDALQDMVAPGVTDAARAAQLDQLRHRNLADALLLIGPDQKRQSWVLASDADVSAQFRIALEQAIAPLPKPPSRGGLTDRRVSIPGRLDACKMVVLAYPTPNGGQACFMLSLDTLFRQFRRSLPNPPDFFLIYSSNDYLVYSSQPLSEMEEQSLTKTIQSQKSDDGWFKLSLDHRPFVFSRSVSPMLKRMKNAWPEASAWRFLLAHDMNDYLGTQDALIWVAVLASSALVLVLMGLSSLMARRLTRPLYDLKQQATLLASGRLDVRAVASSLDEIGDLADAFNVMAIQLEKTWRELTSRSEENRLRAGHVNILNSIIQAGLARQNMETIFEGLRRDLRRTIAFDAFWLARMDLPSRRLRVTHAWPRLQATPQEDGEISLRESLHGAVMEREETLHAEIGPRQRGDFFETRLKGVPNYQSYLIAPLLSPRGVIGMLAAASTTPDAFNQGMADMFTSLASAIAILMEQAEDAEPGKAGH
jgi:HAMP domain-containing protein